MEYKKALSKAMYLCSRKEYCVTEIFDKLCSWKVSEGKIEKIIKYLIKEQFIDEKRYVKHFVHDKIWLNKWGKRKVEFALKIKKVDPGITTTILDLIDTEKYYNLILNELEKKTGNIKSKSKINLKAKLFNFGANRGYENDYLYRAIDELVNVKE